MKINQSFVRLGPVNSRLTATLTIAGDQDELILRKGEGFDAWLADATKIILRDGTETTFNGQNQEVLRQIVVAWLHGEEFHP
jgi:hypothetical protein